MASRVVWTKEARSDLRRIARYLVEEFSIRVAESRTSKYLDIIDQIAEHPTKGAPTSVNSMMRRWPLDKHNFVVYEIDEHGIIVKNIIPYKINRKT